MSPISTNNPGALDGGDVPKSPSPVTKAYIPPGVFPILRWQLYPMQMILPIFHVGF